MGSRKLTGLILGLASWFLLVGLAQAAEFSAVCVTKTAGHELPGKIFVKGEKVRVEASTPLGRTISILRLDKKVMWILMPGQKSYMEMPFDQKALSKALNMPEAGASKKLVGTETINGLEAEKYLVGSGEGKSTVWIAKKLGVPIRVESANKSFSQDYRDIKLGGVADALFEMPAGYKKMAGAAGMPKMTGMPKMK